MKIGLYGGSFDPLHFGHLNLAIELKEKRGLDEVWFCPAQISPFKLHSAPNVDGKNRLIMLKSVLEEIPGFRVLDIEVQREGPSYTVDTLLELRSQFPEHEFYMLMGEDALPHFFQWHKAEEIATLAKLLIGTRTAKDFSKVHGSPEIQAALKAGLTQTRMMDISSTEVRERLKKREYCGHLVPAKILAYIYQNRLYCLQ